MAGRDFAARVRATHYAAGVRRSVGRARHGKPEWAHKIETLLAARDRFSRKSGSGNHLGWEQAIARGVHFGRRRDAR
jgi:hypothetical protein